MLAAGHDQLTNSVASFAVKLGELQGAGPTSGLPSAPGLNAVESLGAKVVGLDAELRGEKGRTAQFFLEVDSRLAELQAEARRSAEAAAAAAATVSLAPTPFDPMAHGNKCATTVE